MANIEAFRDGMLEPSPARLEAVLQVLAEADALLRLLPRDDVTVTRPTSMGSMDVCDVITNEVLGLASARQRGIAFEVHQCAQTGQACHAFDGDPVRVAEIVNNVISNAIRYTPSGGHIAVDCRRADGTLTLAVSDSGPGVAEDDRAHIFESGFRGCASGGTSGSGLGLALAKRFAQEHGGSIELLSSTSSGAQFVVKLPGTRLPEASRVELDGIISLL